MNVTEFLAARDWQDQGQGPRYVQLRKRLESAIEAGLLASGHALPSEREIAGLTGLSRVTVRNAIQALVADEVVVQRQGSGSFVTKKAERLEQRPVQLTSFSEDMQSRGLSAGVRWLERSVCLPSEEERVELNLGPEASVTRLARLRLADGHPMGIERAALPAAILPNPLAVDQSLYAELERLDQRPVEATQRISAINIGAEEAALLGMAEGQAGLRITRKSYLRDGRVVEFTRALYRGDAYEFVADLRL